MQQLPDPRIRPTLFLDIDGVLNPTGTTSPPPGYELHATDEYRVATNPLHGQWLAQLATRYQLVWASTWAGAANTVFAPLYDMEQLPHVEFRHLRQPHEGTRKLSDIRDYVDEHAGDLPVAWIDDELYEDAHQWAAERNAPTLLLRTSSSVGMTLEDVQKLLAFVHP